LGPVAGNDRNVQYKTHKNNNVHILYDASLVEASPEALFMDMDAPSLSRGSARFFDHRDVPMVLKRYYRGGLIGKFIKETYPISSDERSRMWTEFRLLTELHSMDLPVPQPVAARCTRTSPVTCRGELVTRRIIRSRTLTDALSLASLPSETWAAVGATIRRFHNNNVYHADLNASNILLTEGNEVYLIDFDKGRIVSGSSNGWKSDNLKRLRRSLEKQKGLDPGLHFTEADWHSLLEGYG